MQGIADSNMKRTSVADKWSTKTEMSAHIDHVCQVQSTL